LPTKIWPLLGVVPRPVPPLLVASGLTVKVKPLNVGEALELIFCAVFITPRLLVKFALLKVAMPLLPLVSASLIVIVPLTPIGLVALAIVKAPVPLLTLVTEGPEPGQGCQVGAPAVDVKHKPALPLTTELIGLDPFPISTPLAFSVLVPVPPLPTVRGAVKVKLAKVGELVVAMF